MKTILPSLLLLLVSCSTIDYEHAKISSATIADVSVETTSPANITLSFQYNIQNYNNIEGIYFCRVHFLGKGDLTLSPWGMREVDCEITKDVGTTSFISRTVLNKKGKVSNARTAEVLRFPVQYYIAIHQKTGVNRKEHLIIGKSDLQTL